VRADPGPAAYGRGGAEPTVTDANLVLGRLDSENFLGGAMRLEATAARRAIDGLSERLALGLEEAAEGILTIVNANMANAISSRTVQKGLDPRGFALVAFGGAGPLHGAEVARALGIPEVIVPAYPGITSAVGLLTTDLKYDAVRTEFQAGNTVDLDRLDTDLAGMQRELTRQLAADGIAPDDAVFERSGDLRYVGQGYELRVPFPDGKLGQAALAQIFARFVELHRAEYGHVFEASPIEIVNVRVTGIGRMPKIAAPRPTRGGSLVEALVKTARCVFRHNGALERLATPFYRRNLLPLEEPIAGPAIVLQTDSTTVVPPGTTLVPQGRRQPNSDDRPIATAGVDGSTFRDRQHYRQRRAGRAGEHRGRDGLQADADVLFVDYPRIRRFRRGIGRCRGARAESAQSTPLQSGPIPGYIRGILNALQARGDKVRPGDVIMHNDAYGGASHGPDVAFAVPMFHDGRLVAFAATSAHHLDIGALTPGSCGIVDAIDAYAEGLQFKAIKVYDRGVRNDAVWQLLRDNIRVSDLLSAIWRRRLPRHGSAPSGSAD
jgi:hypothetical protein